jgi:hypothetical protein
VETRERLALRGELGCGGFPRSNDPEEAVKGELWAGVTPSGWSPVVQIPMKGVLRAVKPREEGLISSNTEPNETQALPLISLLSCRPWYLR